MRKQIVVVSLAAIALVFAAGVITGEFVSAQAKFPSAKTLFSKDLPEFEGHEAQIIEVTLDPGAQLGGHRHSGHMFVYVVEGEIVSQLEDGEKIAYKPGDFWYEEPMMLHADFFNASETEKAKAVIFSVVEKGKPQTLLEPAHEH